MPEDKEELKARLMAESKAAVNHMLTEAADQGRLSITDIERLARRTGE